MKRRKSEETRKVDMKTKGQEEESRGGGGVFYNYFLK